MRGVPGESFVPQISHKLDRLLESLPSAVIGKQKDDEIVDFCDLFYANPTSRKGFSKRAVF